MNALMEELIVVCPSAISRSGVSAGNSFRSSLRPDCEEGSSFDRIDPGARFDPREEADGAAHSAYLKSNPIQSGPSRSRISVYTSCGPVAENVIRFLAAISPKSPPSHGNRFPKRQSRGYGEVGM